MSALRLVIPAVALLCLTLPAQADVNARMPPPLIDAQLPSLDPILEELKMMLPSTSKVIEYQIGDWYVSCVFSDTEAGGHSASCRACLGPGRTHSFVVEQQGDGFAVGVPGKDGFYAEQDAVFGRADCP